MNKHAYLDDFWTDLEEEEAKEALEEAARKYAITSEIELAIRRCSDEFSPQISYQANLFLKNWRAGWRSFITFPLFEQLKWIQKKYDVADAEYNHLVMQTFATIALKSEWYQEHLVATNQGTYDA